MSCSPTVIFALVVIQHPDNKRFVLTHENKKRGWWLPGGGVDAGQSIEEAAVREALEEAGVKITLTGVLRVEHDNVNRLRVIYHGRPVDASIPLKSVPDHHSNGARWVTLEDVILINQNKQPNTPDCYLRGSEPLEWFNYITKGGKIHPINSVITTKIGSVPEWDGPGDAPRAFYPTELKVMIMAWDCEKKNIVMDGEHLPSTYLETRELFLQAANRLVVEFCEGAEFGGILRINHLLDVSSSDSHEHNAKLSVVFQVINCTHTKAQWKPIDELPKEISELILMPALPLEILDSEHARVACP